MGVRKGKQRDALSIGKGSKKRATAKKAREVKSKPEKEEKPQTLLERVMSERKQWSGTGAGKGRPRELARMAYHIWLMSPVRFRGGTREELGRLGIRDEDTLEVLQCGSVGAFGEKYQVAHQALATWRKEFEATDEGKDIRAFFRPLIKEGLGALYQKLLENGDSERFKTIAAYTEGWVPTIGLQHSGEIGGGLTDEEQAELDRLLAKNKLT